MGNLPNVIKPTPKYRQFDLRKGDIIKEIVRCSESKNSAKLKTKVLHEPCYYIVEGVFNRVFLVTRIKYNLYTNTWTPIYKESFMKLDYLQGLLVKKED